MTTETENTAPAASENENKALALTSSEELSTMLAASSAKNLDKAKPVLSLTQTTFELKNPGDTFRGLFWGFGTKSSTDRESGEVREQRAVQILKDQQIHLNSGVNLVGTFEEANLKQGTAVEIKLREITSKNVKIYDVALLA